MRRIDEDVKGCWPCLDAWRSPDLSRFFVVGSDKGSDAEQCQGPLPVPGKLTQSLGDVSEAGQPEATDGEVPQSRKGARCVPSAYLGAVLVKGHISDPVQPVLDLPMSPDQFPDPGSIGCLGPEAGDPVNGFLTSFAALAVLNVTHDAEHLAHVRKVKVVIKGGTGLDRALLKATVPLTDRYRRRGKKRPGSVLPGRPAT